ncbi:MAG: bifunctional phosphoserine phosphatase/homoserine phosphotransferase ThrH [Candidatus Pacebacteria bacterium]|nr:bifunctional phosphoserine phosphatase/homoserine phosphotransferase ThrH [Candidatus Paceibacterota bacterium]
MQNKQPIIVAFDLEGTLMPEMWVEIAEHKGIEELRKTTADIADYNELKALRVKALAKHGIALADMQSIIEETKVYKGAWELLKWVNEQEGVQPVIVSDTFYQFVIPVIKKLGNPMIFCNTLTVNNEGYVVGYERRQEDQKRAVVRSFHDMNFKVIAIGDSFNDAAMFEDADAAAFYRANDVVREQFPQYRSFQTYNDVKEFISQHI